MNEVDGSQVVKGREGCWTKEGASRGRTKVRNVIMVAVGLEEVWEGSRWFPAAKDRGA